MLVGLCGNPNVGKSTLFNRLTGMHQHTGNWPGKTVGSAVGRWQDIELVDTPGSYSLAAHSAEEEVTRDFVLFGAADKLIMVADATNLQQSLILVLQVLEVRADVLLCVNLMDEAQRHGLAIDTGRLSSQLGIPVLPMNAAAGEGTEPLMAAVKAVPGVLWPVELPSAAETALTALTAYLEGQPLPALWLAKALTSGDESLRASLARHLCLDPKKDAELERLITSARIALRNAGFDEEKLDDCHAAALAERAALLCATAVSKNKTEKPRRLDRVLTHPLWGTAIMCTFLALVLWLTIFATNVPSAYLSRWLFSVGEVLRTLLQGWGISAWLVSAVCDGVWRTTAWVVGVMLPPMAVFFPLFTLLEDLGYLPRVAFQLDGAFQCCGACGKQGLCMMMGLGCNAVGVTGSRIIDSPRERLLSLLTNAFMPCNGRFPMMLALTAIFFGGRSLTSALVLTMMIVLGVWLTLLTSKFLSISFLRGSASSFALELPPFRKPQWASVLLRSVLDRTVFVLGRAVSVAAPAGLVIWCLANLDAAGQSLLQWGRQLLEGPGQLICMDGAILLGFLMALPANEIALPAMLLVYSGAERLQDYESFAQLGQVLRVQGWDGFTALAVLLFTLCHWPCATTLLTIRKESGSWGWSLLAALLPTAWGVLLCGMLALCRRFLVA